MPARWDTKASSRNRSARATAPVVRRKQSCCGDARAAAMSTRLRLRYEFIKVECPLERNGAEHIPLRQIDWRPLHPEYGSISPSSALLLIPNSRATFEKYCNGSDRAKISNGGAYSR